jgi:Raf kinase inhibitor-like YbhB/YbcL family protein
MFRLLSWAAVILAVNGANPARPFKETFMAFKIIIPAFPEGGEIPKEFTCEGADISPALEWTGQPRDTKSFAIIMDDPDAPSGTWNHWLLWDLPPAVHSLPLGYKPSQIGISGTNDFGKLGYGGPCPPKGHGPHRYFFRLFALDMAALPLKPGAKRKELTEAMRNHILSETQYMGRYERR